jgi:hypothetical protein
VTKTAIAVLVSFLSTTAFQAASAQAPTPAPAPAEKPAGKPAPEEGAARPAAPKPSQELETMKFLTGPWTCESSMPAGAMGPGSPATKARTTIVFKKDLGGFFYRGDFAMKAKAGPPMKGSVFIGHQPASNLFTFSVVDSMGGVELSTSPGFQGDTIEFTGDAFMMGQKMKVRETITKAGPKEIVHKVEADSGKGFEPMGEDHCKR